MEKNTEKNLRAFIRKQIAEANSITESDLMGDAWLKMKPRFLETVNSLIQKIDDDNYDDAEDLIGQSIAMLKMWKHRLRSGGLVKKVAFNETLDEIKTLDGSNEGFKISDSSILEDGLPNFFQQKSFKDTGIYIYSSHYKRVFKTAGNLNMHDVPGDDNIPTILVDANGESYDFKSLKAENCFKVIEFPSGFNYKTYSSQF